MAVHEENHFSVEPLAAQPLSLKYDGCLGQHCRRKLQCEQPEHVLGSGNGMEAPESLLHRMVHLATRTSGRSPQSPYKTQSATVMLALDRRGIASPNWCRQ